MSEASAGFGVQTMRVPRGVLHARRRNVRRPPREHGPSPGEGVPHAGGYASSKLRREAR